MSRTSSRTRATAAGQTRAISASAASGVLAIVSCIRQCAWLGKPSSLARSARSLTMRAMIALVSVAPPPSPRLTKARHTCSRKARSDAKVSTGSTAERVLTIA